MIKLFSAYSNRPMTSYQTKKTTKAHHPSVSSSQEFQQNLKNNHQRYQLNKDDRSQTSASFYRP
jgi:hypothetical protein